MHFLVCYMSVNIPQWTDMERIYIFENQDVKIQLVQDRMSLYAVAKTLVNICIRHGILTSCALDANCESETPQRLVCNDHVTRLAA